MGIKLNVYMCRSFTTIKTVNFLNRLEYVSEFDTIDNVRFSEYPTILGRKLYEYKKPAGSLKTVSIKTSNYDSPFPDT